MSFHRGRMIKSIIAEPYGNPAYLGGCDPLVELQERWKGAVGCLVTDINYRLPKGGSLLIRLDHPEGEQVVPVERRLQFCPDTKSIGYEEASTGQGLAFDPHDFIDFVR